MYFFKTAANKLTQQIIIEAIYYQEQKVRNEIFNCLSLLFLYLKMASTVLDGGEMSELDDAGTYYDRGPLKVTSSRREYYYMCTRNNNFSNRSQKGKVVVTEEAIRTARIGLNGGMASVNK